MADKLPRIILLPNLLAEEEKEPFAYLTKRVEERVQVLDGLIAESEKEARRYLKHFSFLEGKSFRDIPIAVLNEHTKKEALLELLHPVMAGQTWGVISDAGLPCIADPGAQLVALARKRGVQIEALSGPSSLFLALMLSGLSAQKFMFHGYLERDPTAVRIEIKQLEKESRQKKMTQVCIEAPYRSEQLYKALVETLDEGTLLCVAASLTSSEQFVDTNSVREWRKKVSVELHKKPVVFLFHAHLS